MNRALVAVALAPLVGCATILTGTHQKVAVASTPPANVVVVSGTAANLALRAGEVNEVKERVAKAVNPFLSPEQRALVAAMQPDELVTRLVLALSPAFKNAPPDAMQSATQLFASLPDAAKDTLRDLVGIETLGVTPLTLDLHKGDPYAVVTWAADHQARLLTIDTRLNPAIWWNVLTLGLGAIVDALTGAWGDLTPTKLDYTLEPLPAAPKPKATGATDAKPAG